MKFKIKVRHIGDPESKSWEEDYDENTDNCHAYAKKMIENFNKTLRVGERERELLQVTALDLKSRAKHTWRKVNTVTLMNGETSYDTYECEHCHITGKRFTLNGDVVRDIKFKPKIYNRCDTAESYLKTKAAKGK